MHPHTTELNGGYFERTDIDPVQNTVEDLMLRIGHLESVGNSKGVCLYTIDGMPLTDDPFFNTCELIFYFYFTAVVGTTMTIRRF